MDILPESLGPDGSGCKRNGLPGVCTSCVSRLARRLESGECVSHMENLTYGSRPGMSHVDQVHYVYIVYYCTTPGSPGNEETNRVVHGECCWCCAPNCAQQQDGASQTWRC